MSLNDIMLNNILFSTILKNDNQIINYIFIYGFIILYKFLDLNIYDYYNYICKFYNKNNKIIFISSDKDSSSRYRALMQYIVKNSKVNILREIERYKHTWSSEEKIAYYKVKQTTKFLITDNIYGLISFKEKEIKHNSNILSEEYEHFELSSSVLSIPQLKDFVEKCNIDYDIYLKDQIIKNQLYVDISWCTDNKEIKVKTNKWISSCKFENKFFTDKELILKKLNFFLENKKIYEKRGIPHTLGFLLYGEPGTGKSSFIKSVANKTKFHIINIKLSKNFDFQILHNILFNEEITIDLKIPLNKRIIIFEDIDCMTNVVKSRFNEKIEELTDTILLTDNISTFNTSSNNLINNKESLNNNKESLNNNKESLINNNESLSNNITRKILDQLEENENNNLSFLLNILDGIQEAEDRIIIMTTNKPEELDKALIRSGRIDIKIHFTKATILDIKNILYNFWDEENEIIFDENYNYKFTHADIINICKESNNLNDTLINLKNRL
jgi:hypothetical protein